MPTANQLVSCKRSYFSFILQLGQNPTKTLQTVKKNLISFIMKETPTKIGALIIL